MPLPASRTHCQRRWALLGRLSPQHPLRALLGILLLALSPGLATATRDSPRVAYRAYQIGIASWYGLRVAGHLTASGERYNPAGVTAAHRTLPLGSYVRLTNTRNGRTVVVRINDRGPWVKGRILDLSQGTAQVLRVDGVARIRIETVHVDRSPRPLDSGHPIKRKEERGETKSHRGAG